MAIYMKFGGVDHGTRGIRILLEEKMIEVKRGGEIPEIDFSEYFFGICYSLGDRINAFTPLRLVKRPEDLLSEGGGEFKGTGTEIVRKIMNEADGVFIPGIHRGIKTLDWRISRMYSHVCAPDKVAEAFYVIDNLDILNFVLVDASSNIVSIAVHEGKIVGGLDAPILSPGVLQGPLDVEGIRRAMKEGPIRAFERGGLRWKCEGEEILECLSLGIAMHAVATDLLTNSKTLILGGKEGIKCRELVEEILSGWKIAEIPEMAPAIGAKKIAREVWEGAKEIMGIEVLRSSSSPF